MGIRKCLYNKAINNVIFEVFIFHTQKINLASGANYFLKTDFKIGYHHIRIRIKNE